jgi:lysophospholipase L1-like esterase
MTLDADMRACPGHPQRRKSVRGTSRAWALAALLAVTLLPAQPVLAQEDSSGVSYITPFPANDVYQMTVVGDTFAEGILYGLVEAMGSDQRLVIQRKHRAVPGLMVWDHVEQMRQLEDTVVRDTPHIAVVMLGEGDRQPLRPVGGGRRIPVGAEEWRAEYGRRVDRLMKVLKRKGVAVYWVGLPNLRRADANDDAQMMNEVIRERAYLNGIKYVDTFAGFTDDTGGYSAYGPDLTGKNRLLRQGDGINFTAAGNRKLAHFLERDLKRDLTQAKAERSIPLAGSQAEQDKINLEEREAAARLAAQAAAEETQKSDAAARKKAASQTAATTQGATGEQKADNGRVNLRTIGTGGREEVVQLEIVRPAIPASVVALVTRRESPDKASQMGDTLLDQIAGGITVMSSIMPSSAAGTGVGRQRLSPTQSPFFRVLVKGERLQPRPGRADDMSWPRPEPPEVALTDDAEDDRQTNTTLKPRNQRRGVQRTPPPAPSTPEAPQRALPKG